MIFSDASGNEDLLMVSSPSEKRIITGQTSRCPRWMMEFAATSSASNSGVAPPLGREVTRSPQNEPRQSEEQMERTSLPLKDRTNTLSPGLQGDFEISCRASATS